MVLYCIQIMSFAFWAVNILFADGEDILGRSGIRKVAVDECKSFLVPTYVAEKVMKRLFLFCCCVM